MPTEPLAAAMQPAKLVNKSIAQGLAAIVITFASLTGCDDDWTGGTCEAGCLCLHDKDSCEANGCTWNGSYCPNGPGVDAAVPPDTSVDPAPVDASASCAGPIACSTAQPTCPSGEVPLIADGCWTGACEAVATCDVPPPCADINDQTDCLARADCGAVYTGIDCTAPDGSTCQAGDAACTCTSYVFASCHGKS